MKRFFVFIVSCFLILAGAGSACGSTQAFAASDPAQPVMVIVVDDFGSFDQSGVNTMLHVDAPLTCAVMPFVDNTELNAQQILDAGKEVIVHMPMQAHVSLPLAWYGKTYISTADSREQVFKKLDDAFSSVKGAKGFNVHIGSGVCQNRAVAGYVYDYAKQHNLPFLDSRTHMGTIMDKVAAEKQVPYLGRDEFLEPEGNRSYEGVKRHLMVGAKKALETGKSIVIGHVGVHGGENTARAISDSIAEIRKMGIEIIPLSELYKRA